MSTTATPSPSVGASERRRRLGFGLLGLVIGVAVGVMMHALYAKQSDADATDATYDRNGDGRPDEWWTGEGDATAMGYDRNLDGEPDAFFRVRSGLVESSESDDNFDGRIDHFVRFRFGFPTKETLDLDGNGQLDLSLEYTNGIPYRSVCWPNHRGKVRRIGEYVNGLLRKTYDMTDEKTDPASLVLYDEFGNPSRLAPPLPVER